MFGKNSLLSAGFKTAAIAQFHAELAIEAAKREHVKNVQTAILCGIMFGIAGAILCTVFGA